MTNQHVIIAGVNKCGTTSAFRYLAEHPDVCASSVKEVRFFLRSTYTWSDSTYDEYLTNFSDHSDNHVLLEASPSYFSWGRGVADRILQLIPDVRIIVLIRDPVDRLFSYYRSALVYDNYAHALLEGVSFDEFVDMALKADSEDDGSHVQSMEYRRALNQGCYAAHIQDFGSRFSKEQVHYVFFEDFSRDPRQVMKRICHFIGIRKEFFDEFDFRVENKTRSFRSIGLQKLVYRINMRFEKVLNRNPGLRKFAQKIYRFLNEQRVQSDAQIGPGTRDQLVEYYRKDNAELRRILIDRYRDENFPSWIE